MVSYFEAPKFDSQICDFELCDSPAVSQWFTINVNSDVSLYGKIVFYDGTYYVQAYSLTVGDRWSDEKFTSDNVQKAVYKHKDLLNDFETALTLVKDLQDDGKYIAIMESETLPNKQQIVDAMRSRISELLEA